MSVNLWMQSLCLRTGGACAVHREECPPVHEFHQGSHGEVGVVADGKHRPYILTLTVISD